MAKQAASLVEEIKQNTKLSQATKNYWENVGILLAHGNAVVHFWKKTFCFCWGLPPFRFQFGHLALTLSDRTHISFWSTGTDQTFHRSLEEDIRGEGRVPDHCAKIPTLTSVESFLKEESTAGDWDKIRCCALDEDKVKIWWEKYSKTTCYHGLKNNCAQTVHRALLHGGFGKDKMFDLLKEIRRSQYEDFKAKGLGSLPLDLGMFELMFKDMTDQQFLELDEALNKIIDIFLTKSNDDLAAMMEGISLPSNLEGLPESDQIREWMELFRNQEFLQYLIQTLQIFRLLSVEDKRQLIETMKELFREALPCDSKSGPLLTPIRVFNCIQDCLGEMKIQAKKPFSIL